MALQSTTLNALIMPHNRPSTAPTFSSPVLKTKHLGTTATHSLLKRNVANLTHPNTAGLNVNKTEQSSTKEEEKEEGEEVDVEKEEAEKEAEVQTEEEKKEKVDNTEGVAVEGRGEISAQTKETFPEASEKRTGKHDKNDETLRLATVATQETREDVASKEMGAVSAPTKPEPVGNSGNPPAQKAIESIPTEKDNTWEAKGASQKAAMPSIGEGVVATTLTTETKMAVTQTPVEKQMELAADRLTKLQHNPAAPTSKQQGRPATAPGSKERTEAESILSFVKGECGYMRFILQRVQTCCNTLFSCTCTRAPFCVRVYQLPSFFLHM